MNIFTPKQFIIKLCAISERQGKNETKAANLIVDTLRQTGVHFKIQKFTTYLPSVTASRFEVDGKRFLAVPTSFISGTITNKNTLISSLLSSQKNIRDANINFNPESENISRSNHYFAPSFAVKAFDLGRIVRATKVYGEVRVTKEKHISQNILVGNLIKPKNIFFCHYDSLGPGAIDNASGVAVLLDIAINYPSTLQNNLFVFAGNEELSYDFPIYWGHGYRVFEKKYKKLLSRAKQIFAVDCIGNGDPVFDNSSPIVPLSFPITNLTQWRKKIFAVYGNEEKLMAVYHSELDAPHLVKAKYLQSTRSALLKRL